MRERRLNLIGVLTWFCVGVPSVLWEIERHTLLTPRAGLLYTAFVAFLVLFLIVTQGDCGELVRIPLLIGESLLALTCAYLQPKGFLPVLLVIVAGQLGRYPLRISLPAIALQSAIYGVMVHSVESGSVAIALAYFCFCLFAAFTMQMAHSESEARSSLAEANAELKVTAGLLEINSRASERLRIARDLHDLLGHHLTALTLNLETASHLANGEAREHIETSKSIARRLLGDVRSVVSRLRDEEPVDFTAAVESLRAVITSPSLHLDLPRDLALTDPAVAQVALRTVQEIVTNAVRHAGARNLWLTVKQVDSSLDIEARDDGAGTDDVHFGNGLRGIRERVEEVHGTLEVSSMRGRGFSVRVRLPLEGAPA